MTDREPRGWHRPGLCLGTPGMVWPADATGRDAVQPTKYHIKRKLDMGKGYWINGAWVTTGYVVTRDGCNVMPGAIWFASIADAMRAIECLEYVGGEPALFWDVWNTWKAEGLL